MSKADQISGIFWLFFSGLICIESYRLGLGNLHQPGPGFLFSGQACHGDPVHRGPRPGMDREENSGTGGPIFGKENILKIILVLLSLFLYAFFMECWVSYPVTLLIFIFLSSKLIEKKTWRLTIL